jgi:hypothetical protein
MGMSGTFSTPSQYAINQHTKVTLEHKLGGRAAADHLFSDFGAVTSTQGFLPSNNLLHAHDGSGCFNSATESLEYRLKVECGDKSSGSWVTASTTYTAWATLQVDHAANSAQCAAAGSNFVVTDCNTGATAIIDDSGGYGVAVGDFVNWYDSSGNGPFCGELTSASSGTATGSAYGGIYTDCANCNSTNYLTLYEVTDCNSSTTYILDDSGGYAPTTGDIVYFSDSSGNDVCATVTTVGVSGTAVGTISSTYSDCSSCNSDYSLGGSGGGGGGSGSYIEVQNCADSSTHIVDDYSGISPSVGDVISYYDTNWTNVYCGTVTATGVSGTANYYLSSSYYDCDECNNYEGI